MIGLDLSNYEYTPIGRSGYGYVEYNEIKLVVTENLEWFCANRLYKALKYDKITKQYGSSTWFRQTMIPKLKHTWPDLYHKVEGSNEYKGWYANMSLFNMIGYSIDPERFQLWLMGEPWDNVNKKGVLYMVQPPRCVGSNIVKIGQTSDFRRRLQNNDYGKGTIVLATVKTNSRSIGEHHLKKLFQDNGAISRKDYGTEYYEVDDLQLAKKLFAKIAIKIPELIEGKVLRYRTGSWIHGYEDEDED